MKKCFVNTDKLFWFFCSQHVPSSVAVCTVSCPPFHPTPISHPFSPVWNPHLCHYCGSPEPAPQAAPGVMVCTCLPPESRQPCLSLAGKSWRSASRRGGCVENLKRYLSSLGRKPTYSLLEFYKLCTQRGFSLERKGGGGISYYLLRELGRLSQGQTSHIWPSLLCLQNGPMFQEVAGKTTEQPTFLCRTSSAYLPWPCSPLGLELGFLGPEGWGVQGLDGLPRALSAHTYLNPYPFNPMDPTVRRADQKTPPPGSLPGPTGLVRALS